MKKSSTKKTTKPAAPKQTPEEGQVILKGIIQNHDLVDLKSWVNKRNHDLDARIGDITSRITKVRYSNHLPRINTESILTGHSDTVPVAAVYSPAPSNPTTPRHPESNHVVKVNELVQPPPKVAQFGLLSSITPAISNYPLGKSSLSQPAVTAPSLNLHTLSLNDIQVARNVPSTISQRHQSFEIAPTPSFVEKSPQISQSNSAPPAMLFSSPTHFLGQTASTQSHQLSSQLPYPFAQQNIAPVTNPFLSYGNKNSDSSSSITPQSHVTTVPHFDTTSLQLAQMQQLLQYQSQLRQLQETQLLLQSQIDLQMRQIALTSAVSGSTPALSFPRVELPSQTPVVPSVQLDQSTVTTAGVPSSSVNNTATSTSVPSAQTSETPGADDLASLLNVPAGDSLGLGEQSTLLTSNRSIDENGPSLGATSVSNTSSAAPVAPTDVTPKVDGVASPSVPSESLSNPPSSGSTNVISVSSSAVADISCSPQVADPVVPQAPLTHNEPNPTSTAEVAASNTSSTITNSTPVASTSLSTNNSTLSNTVETVSSVENNVSEAVPAPVTTPPSQTSSLEQKIDADLHGDSASTDLSSTAVPSVASPSSTPPTSSDAASSVISDSVSPVVSETTSLPEDEDKLGKNHPDTNTSTTSVPTDVTKNTTEAGTSHKDFVPLTSPHELGTLPPDATLEQQKQHALSLLDALGLPTSLPRARRLFQGSLTASSLGSVVDSSVNGFPSNSDENNDLVALRNAWMRAAYGDTPAVPASVASDGGNVPEAKKEKHVEFNDTVSFSSDSKPVGTSHSVAIVPSGTTEGTIASEASTSSITPSTTSNTGEQAERNGNFPKGEPLKGSDVDLSSAHTATNAMVPLVSETPLLNTISSSSAPTESQFHSDISMSAESAPSINTDEVALNIAPTDTESLTPKLESPAASVSSLPVPGFPVSVSASNEIAANFTPTRPGTEGNDLKNENESLIKIEKRALFLDKLRPSDEPLSEIRISPPDSVLTELGDSVVSDLTTRVGIDSFAPDPTVISSASLEDAASKTPDDTPIDIVGSLKVAGVEVRAIIGKYETLKASLAKAAHTIRPEDIAAPYSTTANQATGINDGSSDTFGLDSGTDFSEAVPLVMERFPLASISNYGVRGRVRKALAAIVEGQAQTSAAVPKEISLHRLGQISQDPVKVARANLYSPQLSINSSLAFGRKSPAGFAARGSGTSISANKDVLHRMVVAKKTVDHFVLLPRAQLDVLFQAFKDVFQIFSEDSSSFVDPATVTGSSIALLRRLARQQRLLEPVALMDLLLAVGVSITPQELADLIVGLRLESNGMVDFILLATFFALPMATQAHHFAVLSRGPDGPVPVFAGPPAILSRTVPLSPSKRLAFSPSKSDKVGQLRGQHESRMTTFNNRPSPWDLASTPKASNNSIDSDNLYAGLGKRPEVSSPWPVCLDTPNSRFWRAANALEQRLLQYIRQQARQTQAPPDGVASFGGNPSRNRRKLAQEDLRLAFQTFDRRGVGAFSLQDLHETLAELGFVDPPQPQLTQAALRRRDSAMAAVLAGEFAGAEELALQSPGAMLRGRRKVSKAGLQLFLHGPSLELDASAARGTIESIPQSLRALYNNVRPARPPQVLPPVEGPPLSASLAKTQLPSGVTSEPTLEKSEEELLLLAERGGVLLPASSEKLRDLEESKESAAAALYDPCAPLDIVGLPRGEPFAEELALAARALVTVVFKRIHGATDPGNSGAPVLMDAHLLADERMFPADVPVTYNILARWVYPLPTKLRIVREQMQRAFLSEASVGGGGKDFARAFVKKDGNGNGSISVQEFVTSMGSLAKGLTQQEIFALCDYFDVDGSGQIDFHEFLGIMSGNGGTMAIAVAKNIQNDNEMAEILQL